MNSHLQNLGGIAVETAPTDRIRYTIDRKIYAIAEQIKQTRSFKQGLLQQMFV